MSVYYPPGYEPPGYYPEDDSPTEETQTAPTVIIPIPSENNHTISHLYNTNLLLLNLNFSLGSSLPTLSKGNTFQDYMNNNISLLVSLCSQIGVQIPQLK